MLRDKRWEMPLITMICGLAVAEMHLMSGEYNLGVFTAAWSVFTGILVVFVQRESSRARAGAIKGENG